jgi:hypothetical protein
MTSPMISHTSKTLLTVLFAASLVLTPCLAWAQNYTDEEYKQYQDIQAENDANKKTDMIIRFIREKPKNELRSYMVAEFQKTLSELEKEKKFQQVINLGEKYVAVVPDDNYTIAAMAAAYGQTGNVKGFAAFGEKAYASKPSGQLAKAIAGAYKELGNEAKFIQWAEKTTALMPDDVEMLYELTRSKMASSQLDQATKYAKLCLKALPNAKKPENRDELSWKNSLSAMYAASYGAIGAAAYQNNNYTEAITNLDNAVKHLKRNESAYYFLGMCYWRQNKIDAAELNFAKAYLIKGSTTASAKQYLDNLWKAGHRNSTAGEERVLERAGQDLK